jgi:hypothetical protein
MQCGTVRTHPGGPFEDQLDGGGRTDRQVGGIVDQQTDAFRKAVGAASDGEGRRPALDGGGHGCLQALGAGCRRRRRGPTSTGAPEELQQQQQQPG